MFKLANDNLGDVWPFWDDAKQIMHLYFLQSPVDALIKNWHIGHAVSRNLIDWEYDKIVLSPGEAGSFDDLGLATGSVLADHGRYYMAYTAHSKRDHIKCGTVGIAVSDDLYHWQKLPGPVAVLDASYYENEITGSRPFLHWRDPFLIKVGQTYHILLCARNRTGAVKTRGTVAHLTSTDLKNWQTQTPLHTALFCEEMECPQVFDVDHLWYLFFSTHRELIDPACCGDSLPDGGVFYQTANQLDGDFTIKKSGKIEVHFSGHYFYAPQFFSCQGKHYLIGTLFGENGPSYISDPVELILDNGEITVKK